MSEYYVAQKTNAYASATASMNKYSIYSLITNGKYKYLSRINNTLVYIELQRYYKRYNERNMLLI